MTLYELTGDWIRLMEFIEDPDMDQEMLMETWLDLDASLEDKADGYAKVMAEEKARIEALKAEAERLTARRKTIENNVERLKKSLMEMMIATGKTKFKTNLFSFGVQKNPPSVKISDTDAVPVDYMIPQPMKIDTVAIKELLKSGAEVDWAHLEQSDSLRIR